MKTAKSSISARIPPELCAIIARYSTRQSIARLSAVSHRFNALFAPLLYEDLASPALDASQSRAVIGILSRASAQKSHHAVHVRRLSVTDAAPDVYTARVIVDVDEVVTAMRNLHQAHPDGAPLVALEWRTSTGLDELGSILSEPGRFPQLKDLRVASDGLNESFEFMKVNGLESFGLSLKLHLSKHKQPLDGEKVLGRLSAALEQLPAKSPALRAFQLRIHFIHKALPENGIAHLVDTINRLRFPALEKLEISIDFMDDDDFGCDEHEDILDVSEFLAAHPNILDLAFELHDTEVLSKERCFWPRLRSFKGTPEDAEIILSHGTPMESLELTFVVRDWEQDEVPVFRVLPKFKKHETMRSVRVMAPDLYKWDGSVIKSPAYQTSDTSLEHLAASFPNLTTLDFFCERFKRVSSYLKPLAEFKHLETLRMQEYRDKAPKGRSLAQLVPPTKYTSDIQKLLGALTRLKRVEICVFGDDMDSDWCYHDMCRLECLMYMLKPARVTVELDFVVERARGGGRGVRLEARREKDDRGKKEAK